MLPGPFRKIDDIGDVETTLFVAYEDCPPGIVESLGEAVGSEFRVCRGNAEAMMSCVGFEPDIIFVGPSGDPDFDREFTLCRTLRETGFNGVVVLVSRDGLDIGGTSHVTGEGFDNFMLESSDRKAVEETVHWAILNRRRRNKHKIQFDGNPDSFFTLDEKGNLYDVNMSAAESSGLSPRDVIKMGVNVKHLGSLPFFDKVIRPRITVSNVGSHFNDTVDEVEKIFQVKTKVHNVPTIGLVATVIKTDITRAMYSRTLDILVNSITLLSERDNYTASHSSRVYYYCSMLADALGLSSDGKFLRALYFAALLHDIGKIGIKDRVLLKPGKLTDQEFSELTTHPEKGFNMLRKYKFLKDSTDLVRSHHERPDGCGYPEGLKGAEISMGAHVISVADCFDAMTSNRPYRSSLSFDAAVAEIKENLGTQFDVGAGKAFLSIIKPDVVERVREASDRPLSSISGEIIGRLLRE